MVLIGIFLKISDVEHLFICLLAICISSLEQCPFKSFAHLLIGFFDFFVVVIGVLKSIFWILISCQIYDLQILSPTL